MHTPGDEMELFASVNRKFRHLFSRQEHMKTFRVYDMVEVSLSTKSVSDSERRESLINNYFKTNSFDYFT